MAKEKSTEDPSVFDVSKIRELIALMKEHDLSEVDLKEADRRIRLRRGGNEAPMFVGYPPPATTGPAIGGQAASVSASPPGQAAEDEGNFEYITSPTVGTFYSKSKPDTPDFVKVGDIVDVDTVVCLVEAMKMFNEIPAGIAGKVVSCLVKNEDPVDVGKPLFKIAPN